MAPKRPFCIDFIGNLNLQTNMRITGGFRGIQGDSRGFCMIQVDQGIQENSGSFNGIHEDHGRIQGDLMGFRVIQGDSWRFREIQEDLGRFKDIQEDSWRFKEIQEDSGRFKEIQGSKKILWNFR